MVAADYAGTGRDFVLILDEILACTSPEDLLVLRACSSILCSPVVFPRYRSSHSDLAVSSTPPRLGHIIRNSILPPRA
eukprot:15477032-Alexandrium_andersonii.AAC.1